MKKSLTTFLIAYFGIAFFTLKAQSSSDAVTYMSSVTTPFAELKTETWQYMKAVTRGKGVKKVESKRQNLLTAIRSAKTEVNRIGAYDSDFSFRNSIISYWDLTYIVLKEDYGKILSMEDIAEQSYDLMEAYLLAKEKAGEKLDSAGIEYEKAQQKFANDNNIKLIDGQDDRTTEKIKKAGRALKYYNELYLIFFKCYKQEAYVLEAQSRGDVAAATQNNSTLTLYADDQIRKLKEIENYDGDASLKEVTLNLLSFYKEESLKEFPVVNDFYIKKDNMEKLQKTMDSKNKKTQPDIDQFNKAVNEYNLAVKQYNTMVNSANSKRSKMLDLWNQTGENFLERHSN